MEYSEPSDALHVFSFQVGGDGSLELVLQEGLRRMLAINVWVSYVCMNLTKWLQNATKKKTGLQSAFL